MRWIKFVFAVCLAGIISDVQAADRAERHPITSESSSGPMVGGWTDVTGTNKPEIQSIVDWTLGQTRELKSVGSSDKLTVEHVKTQVVAGMNYDILMKQTTADGKCFEHHLIVYDVPYKHERTITTNETKEC